MAQTAALVDTLKLSLKAHGKTYADVARYLRLSEASVKRLFSDKNFSLQRLDEICQMLNMEISDLVQLMSESNSEHLTELSQHQEEQIASDIGLLVVAVCALNRWTMQDIIEYFHITVTQCILLLARLDKLKLIELLPKNKIKILVAANFKWRDNGPIQHFFLEKLQADFFDSTFKNPAEKFVVINGMLATSSIAVFQRKMDHLVREFDELNVADAGLDLEKKFGTTVVFAMRPWAYGLFDQIRKK